jgi:hypothetical protein
MVKGFCCHVTKCSNKACSEIIENVSKDVCGHEDTIEHQLKCIDYLTCLNTVVNEAWQSLGTPIIASSEWRGSHDPTKVCDANMEMPAVNLQLHNLQP